MKTVLIALEFPPSIGGVENYYSSLAKYWPDEFIVIDNHSQQLLNKNLFFAKWLTALKTILSTIRGAKPDWLIVGEILPLGTAAWLASFFVNYKYCVVLHGLDFSLATRSVYKRWLSKKILNKAKLIICANSKTAELAAAFISNKEKVFIVNPGVEQQKPIIRPGLTSSLKSNYGLDNDIVLISICRLVKRKGIDSVISIMPQILEKYPNTAYLVIGNGPEEGNLKNLARDPALKGKVFVLTDVNDEQKWAWLENSDIFIMPTKEISTDYEGFGIVYLEANLFSKPVIATNCGGVKDAVINQLNGLLVTPNDPEALVLAITQLIDDEQLRIKLGQQGRERAIKDFSWQKQAEIFYEKLRQSINL